MAKKRISVDFDLSNLWDKEMWDYLNSVKMSKNKSLKNALYYFINKGNIDIEDTIVDYPSKLPNTQSQYNEEFDIDDL